MRSANTKLNISEEAVMAVNAVGSGQIKLGDLNVNRLGFGAMRITGEGIWGEPKDKAEALAVLKRAVELGVNFIDTADAYGPEVSENLIKEALYPYDGVVIATKGGLTRQGPGEWTPNGTPEHLRHALEGSLDRLGIGVVDLYQFHHPDPNVPFMESLKALIELKGEGKIRNLGLSNVSLAELKQAMDSTSIVSVQNRYNVFESKDSEQVLDYCEEHGIAFIPYFPIGGNGTSLVKLNQIADKHGATIHQIALAWLLQKSSVMLPIPGTGSVKHLEENVEAININLDSEDLSSLE
jgi:pyridoxine 4-dehydrogenase